MWKECFGDSDEFIDLYFSEKYIHKNTLVYFHRGTAVASLQMLPYTITFYGQPVPFYYLSGLCTLPQYRRMGFMARLIDRSHEVMKERGIPLSVLIPAGDGLYRFYEKFGYEQVFEGDDHPLYMKGLLNSFPNLEDAYGVFDEKYNKRDFCVQKSFDDFKTIVKEYYLDGCPVKHNLSGMARIIDSHTLLGSYAADRQKESTLPDTTYIIEVTNGDNSVCYRIQRGSAEIIRNGSPDYKADIRLLCRLLFGFKVNELPATFHKDFKQHHPIMNLMLE